MKKLLALSITLAFSMAPTLSNAAGTIDAGKDIATSCEGCHGVDGNSMVPIYPKLAGQHAEYLVQQLHDFKEGSRNDPMMASFASSLDHQAMEDVAAFYSSKKISVNQAPFLEPEDDDEEENVDNTAEINALIELGGDLYRNGNLKSKVSACIACHGPSGEGNKPAAYPSLYSQQSDYLIKTLTDFKNGDRTNTTDTPMHMIAKKMTKKEIQAVSFYISMMK